MPKYVSSAKVREVYGIDRQTLRNWAVKGSVSARAIINPSGRRTWMYDLESIGSNMEPKGEVDESASPANDHQKPTIIYCRVSSKKQLPDLERQIALLRSAYPDSEVVSDIGSGINYNKPGFTKMVEMVCREQIARIVVTFKDRILRFGHELFYKICKEHGVQIVVYADECDDLQDQADREKEELQEDLLSVVNVFVARRNGKKAGIMRRLRKEQSKQHDQDQAISDEGSDEEVESDLQHSSSDLQ
jgi:putative resolvase